MAQKIVLIDDLDGSESVETLRYTVGGQDYEIDLSQTNAAGFYGALQPYMDKSRKVEPPILPTRQTRRRTAPPGTGREDIPEIRAWAQAQGIEISPRGRIKKEVIDQYDATHGRAKTA